MRTIKKYPNRRLYDMEESRYITLGDVRRMVHDRVAFRVLDARSGGDITRSILLQVILEQEEDGPRPLLTTELLTQMIRLYGDVLQGMASEFLRGGLVTFSEQRKLFEEQLRRTGGPIGVWPQVAEQQLDLWRRMQETMLGMAGFPSSRADAAPESASAEPESAFAEPESAPAGPPEPERPTGRGGRRRKQPAEASSQPSAVRQDRGGRRRQRKSTRSRKEAR